MYVLISFFSTGRWFDHLVTVNSKKKEWKWTMHFWWKNVNCYSKFRENITSYTISMYINVPSDKVVSYGWQLMISYWWQMPKLKTRYIAESAISKCITRIQDYTGCQFKNGGNILNIVCFPTSTNRSDLIITNHN